ncbi:MAG: hypothetical protein ACHQCH_07375, partial [Solirubrobacterales bacterium]
IWGVATLVVGASNSGAVALMAMFAGGLAYGPYAAIAATILQRAARSKADLLQLGSFWGALTSGATPLGILFGGLIVPILGAGSVLIGTGATMLAIGCLGVTIVAMYHGHNRPTPNLPLLPRRDGST